MRGHIRKRGATWSVVVDVGMDENGKRAQRWRSGFATRKEAERALTETLQALQTGSYIEPSTATVRQFLEEQWLPAIRTTVRSTTYLSYEMYVRLYLGPALGTKRLQQVTPADLNALYASLLKDGREHGDGGLAPSTVRRIHAVTHRAFRDAAKWGFTVRNPVDLADPPRRSAAATPEMQTWTSDEAMAFLRFTAGDRLYGLWFLLLTTGLRRGEAVGVRWQDVDLATKRLAVRQALVTVGHQVETSSPKTTKSRRVVALDGDTVTALQAHRKAQLAERLAWGSAWHESGYVFTYEDGRPLHPNFVTKRFDTTVSAAGLRRIRLHDLRHTSATLALQAGVHPKIVSERLGHATVAFTLDVYSHVSEHLQEQAADAVAALLRPS